MKIVRFNNDRIGVVSDTLVYDVTHLFDMNGKWPFPIGDLMVRQLVELQSEIERTWKSCSAMQLSSVTLESPVANPGKIVGAPINYKAHIEEANADSEINAGKVYTSIDQYGLFIKANSSLVGPGSKVLRRFDERRTDHEVELVVIIGKEARNVARENALDYVLGYCVGLDMTVRGPEFPSFRKSIDTYTVLGPWLVTKDEIADPNSLSLALEVNGEARQNSNTSRLIFDVQRLIEYASSFYTLHPGDVIMTGTPDGVGPVLAGDRIKATIESVGTLDVEVGRWDPLLLV